MSLPSGPAPLLPDVRLAGFLHSGLGLGETGRRIARSLTAAGVPLSTLAWEKTDVATVPFETGDAPALSGATGSRSTPGISLLSLNGDQIPSFLQQAGAEFVRDRYVISVWFWELPELPVPAADGFRQVDEVWAATPFIRDALVKRAGEVPVNLFPHPVEPPAGSAEQARSRFPFEDRFVFLFSFDYQSCAKRKNPGAVCEAFVRAFPEPRADGPLCVIKSINAALHPADHALLVRRWSDRPDIVFLDGFLSAADRDLLCWRADACVSLHRSEGLGVTLLEGMSLGKPAIATGWSGNTSFMTPENSWLIPWERVPVGPGSLHYESTQLWAEPDVAAAAAALRETAAGGAAVRARAETGRRQVLESHHPEVCGRAMLALLQTAASRTPRKKPALPGRRTLTEALKAARQAESALSSRKLPRWPWQKAAAGTARLQELTGLIRAQRAALDAAAAALRHQDQQARLRHQHLLRQNERLNGQLAEIIRQLPPPPSSPSP